MTRDEMKDWLIDNDVDYILTTSGGLEWLRDILETGLVGYDNLSDEELRADILGRDKDAFNREIPCLAEEDQE